MRPGNDMTMTCTICRHPQHQAINADIVRLVSYRRIAAPITRHSVTNWHYGTVPGWYKHCCYQGQDSYILLKRGATLWRDVSIGTLWDDIASPMLNLSRYVPLFQFGQLSRYVSI
jgi:hypothetical protein